MPSAETIINRLIVTACFAAIGFVCLIVWLLVTPSPGLVDNATIERRIQPLDRVDVATVTDATASGDTRTSSETGSSSSLSGESIVENVCIACHGSGAAGAPKLGDRDDWDKRIAASLDALTKTAIAGLNAMPPKGGLSGLTDDQIREAVKWMIAARESR